MRNDDSKGRVKNTCPLKKMEQVIAFFGENPAIKWISQKNKNGF